VFVIAVYGTLAMPIVLAVAARRSPPSRRARVLLCAAAGWVALCAVAGVARLATEDGYYAPNHVTFWEHSSDGERQLLVLLILATALAAIALFVMRRRTSLPAAVALASGALAATLVMLVVSVALGLH
jgi:hypothetical protein